MTPRVTAPSWRGRARAAWVLAAYTVLAGFYTHPLLLDGGRRIANDPYDPVLNASILWWNATTVPFSPAWWTPPHYYPSPGVAAFTENLAGLMPVSGPIFWLTRDPVLTYNLTLFLTWPLCGLATYLLVRRLTGRDDAAFFAGLVFAFTPYRVAQLAHLQVLACYWLPCALFALHAYVADPRRRWLVLFGGAWLLQSWSNGYFMLFGALLIACWLAYFPTRPDTRRLLPALGVTWFLASLPLVPVLLQYHGIHRAYALERPYQAIAAFGAQASAWWHVSNLVTFWSPHLPDAGAEWNLFPGATPLLVVCLAAGVALLDRAGRGAPGHPARRAAAVVAGATAVVLSAMVVGALVGGPWRIDPFGIRLRVITIGRESAGALAAATAWLLLSARGRAALRRRSPLLFYLAATIAIVALSMGPVIRSGTRVMLEHAPYAWLLALPGFDGLRVPPRFWMVGLLCLAVAAGVGFARITRVTGVARRVVFLLAVSGVMADGWLRRMPMAPAPDLWPRVEQRGRDRPLLELPLGPRFDAAATFRAVGHRRRVVNGVSGYDPPHYAPLQRALADRDPSMLTALASLGPVDVVVDGSSDPGGAWQKYVTEVPGARRIASEGDRVLFEVTPIHDDARASEPVALVRVSDPSTGTDLQPLFDQDAGTGWHEPGDRPLGTLLMDLGEPRAVTRLVVVPRGHPESFRSRVEIAMSTDGVAWQDAWTGSTMGVIVVGIMRNAQRPELAFPLGGGSARFIRVRRLDRRSLWSIAELRVDAVPLRTGS